MNKLNNPKLTKNSQTLRKNMTKQERKLWYEFLRGLDCTVKRQKVIDKYITDFYIPTYKLVIELDGSQHYEEKGEARDVERDRFFASEKITVLRYSNYDVNTQFSVVCQDILNHIDRIKNKDE